MKTLLLLPLAMLYPLFSQAQYYYNDILLTRESSQKMQVYLSNKVKRITATGFTPQGSKVNDFSEVSDIKENGKVLKVSNNADLTLTVSNNRYDENGRLISINDSAFGFQSVSRYEYDNDGKLILIQNTIKDSSTEFDQVEIHKWIYNNIGLPVKMWRIINGTDSLQILFTPDENGNVGDEKTIKKGVETGVIYYYYDEKNRLSDIVRYNTRLKRLLPDIMFEYDDSDRVIQKITTTSSLNMGYLIWRYIFNEKGLKTKEALFNNNKEITGKIEYTYSF